MLSSQLDYIGIGQLLLDILEKRHPVHVSFEKDTTAIDIAEMLQESVDDELIEDLMVTEVGKGILIGIIVTNYAADREQDETQET